MFFILLKFKIRCLVFFKAGLSCRRFSFEMYKFLVFQVTCKHIYLFVKYYFEIILLI